MLSLKHFVESQDKKADLTKIDTMTLRHLASLHRRNAEKDPAAKDAAERGEAELKRREMKEEVKPNGAIAKGDFVKDPRGKVHRVFDVQDTTLHTAEYRGNNSYGGKTTLHISKATKVARPVGEEVELDEEQQGVTEDIANTRREVNLKKKIDKGVVTPEQKKEYQELKAKNMGRPVPKQSVAEGSLEEEQINELSKDTLKSYTKKANDEVNAIKKKQADHPRGHISGADADKKLNRQIGINQATKRIVKKDLTGVAEGSDHDDDYSTASFEKWKNQKEYEKEYDKKKPAKPIVPDNKDKKKGVAEGSLEEEQINELSKDTLKSYKHKAGQDARAHSSASLKAFKQGDEEKGDAHFNKSYKRMTGVAKSINKLLNKGVKEEVELDEAISVEHDRYMRSHGKKASGTGDWMFTHKRAGDVDYKNDKEVHRVRGSFTDAAKSAKAWAKSHGHSSVYVMEEVELDESGFADDFLKMVQKRHPQAKLTTGAENKKEVEDLMKKRVASGVKPVYPSPGPDKYPLGGYDPVSHRSYSEQFDLATASVREILGERKLSKPEMKKREEIATAIEKDNPSMPMDKKMAIATAAAKKVA